MKTALYVVFVFIALYALISSCTPQKTDDICAIDTAEEAFADGRYAKAQKIADSIMIGSSFSTMNATQLCRLSLLYTRLVDRSTEDDANTAMATRALEAAFALDSDSTASFLNNVPVDDRARIVIINALTNARSDGDSIILEPDSIVY